MGNLCAIFHAHFDRLVALTNSHNKAVFLDKCIYWWQFSKYTLDDESIWFTRSLPEMAKVLSISERSVSRYLEEFERMGLIERTCRLSASNKNNQFGVTKRLYIRVTNKLLQIVQITNTKKITPMQQAEDCSFSNQLGEIEKDNLAQSIYKVKDYKQTNNNTVRQRDIVNNLEKPIIQVPQASSSTSHYPIEHQIGERITEPLKNYIKGMLTNVRSQHKCHFSDPNKLFAEVIFSVTQDIQWPGVDNPHHRVNIIAKLLRLKQWKTPKGFYNHWDVGQFFRKKEIQAFQKNHQSKIDESQTVSAFVASQSGKKKDSYDGLQSRFEEECPFSKTKPNAHQMQQKQLNSALQEIIMSLRTEESYLRQLEEWLENNSPCVTQSLIESVAKKIARLYEDKAGLESELLSIKEQAA